MHKWFIAWLLLFLPVWVNFALAENSAVNQPANQAYLDLKLTQDIGAEWQLEVRQVPLAQTIDRIAKQAGVPIHFSVLPEGMVTATCAGSSLKPVLACLLNHKADLIVRYPKNNRGDNAQIVEAWVLGSKLDGFPVTRMDCVAVKNQPAEDKPMDKQQQLAEDQFRITLDLARSKNPEERATAVGNLLASGHDGDEEIKAVLEDALHDENASVRAQAISTMTHRGDSEDTTSVIQEGLKDSSVDVRMMAVDGIKDNIGLLQQAVNDADETVREVATMKLEELMRRQKSGKLD